MVRAGMRHDKLGGVGFVLLLLPNQQKEEYLDG